MLLHCSQECHWAFLYLYSEQKHIKPFKHALTLQMSVHCTSLEALLTDFPQRLKGFSYLTSLELISNQ